MQRTPACLLPLAVLPLSLAAAQGPARVPASGPAPTVPGGGLERFRIRVRDGGPFLQKPAWTVTSNQANSLLGTSVSDAGDVDGDGFADVIVGTPFHDGAFADAGRAEVYLGSATGLASAPAWSGEGDQFFALYGVSVASAGDVNGDGYDDVIVGASSYSHGQSDEGRAYVYLGSSAGLASAPAWTAEPDQANAYFGISVSTAGDVNGDGFDDVLVGALYYDGGQTNEGRAYVYLGSAAGLAGAPAWTAESNQKDASFGTAVSTAGDVNGDGYDDVLVGADGFDNDQPDEGRAYVFLGSAAGLASTPAWTVEGNQSGASFASAVAAAGDVNGDGYGDVLVGAPFFSAPELAEGRAFLYLGSAAGLAGAPAWTAESDEELGLFAYSLKGAGDVDGNGRADVIVGAYNLLERTGVVFVYAGRASGLTPDPVWAVKGPQTTAEFGRSVSGSGDVNGDGLDDLVVGAPQLDDGERAEGAAFGFLAIPWP